MIWFSDLGDTGGDRAFTTNIVTWALHQMGAHDHNCRWSDVLKDDPCSYCRRRCGRRTHATKKHHRYMTVDHIVPKAAGGDPCIHPNGAGACSACNGRKADDSLLSFIAKGGLGRAIKGNRWI